MQSAVQGDSAVPLTVVRTPPVPPAVLKDLGFGALDAAGAAGLLHATLAARVSERFPREAAHWPLTSQRFRSRPYLAGQRVELPVDERGRPLATPAPFVYPTGTTLLALDPLPGVGANLADEVLWVVLGHIAPPGDQAAHDALRAMAGVADGGALFVLLVDALKARDGAWTVAPEVSLQIDFNLARHRKLLGADPEATRQAVVRPSRVAEVLGIRTNALANGVKRAKPGSRYARLAAGRAEGGFTLESVEMTAVEWGIRDQDRLRLLKSLRVEIEAQIVAAAEGALTSARLVPGGLERVGPAVWRAGPKT